MCFCEVSEDYAVGGQGLHGISGKVFVFRVWVVKDCLQSRGAEGGRVILLVEMYFNFSGPAL